MYGDRMSESLAVESRSNNPRWQHSLLGSPFDDGDEVIRQALAEVSVPALLMSLVHMTGDLGLLEELPKPFMLIAMDLQGAAGVLNDPEVAEAAGQFQAMLMSSPSTRIAGGTDEILRNIIAERVLGLPGDIRVDKDVPFNKIPTKGR